MGGLFRRFFKKFKETPQTAFSNYPFENAKLISVDAEGEIQTHLSKVAISNGLEWDRKTNKFYHIDSSKHAIFQYELTERGQLLFEKVVYTFKIVEGYPAGMTIDSEGNLYVTLFKSGLMAKTSKEQTRVVCINPQDQSRSKKNLSYPSPMSLPAQSAGKIWTTYL